MTDATIDVIVPVWNRPDETRNCLVNLINDAPYARLIMVDNGSDRDTERLLQEFADRLDERALLMRDDSNIGFVRAANRGLERSQAPFVAVVRSTTVVPAGVLERLLEFAKSRPEAGILLPTFEPAEPLHRPIEVESGSFAAMVLTRELFRTVGGFDEGMDGGAWCLRDYTRRACSRGWFTFQVPTPPVAWQEEAPLGSELRRHETLQRSMKLFGERWGEGRNYVLHVPKGVELELLAQKLELLVQGARHGDGYTVLLPASLYQAARQAGHAFLHEKVTLVPMPRLALNGMKKRLYERVAGRAHGTVPVTAVDGMPFPWSERYLSFTELSERIRERSLQGA